jgi:chromosome segregation ATPase
MIGWIMVILIVVGGVGVSVWAAQERTAVEERLAGVQGDLDKREGELSRTRDTAERAEAGAQNLAEALESCADAVLEHIRAFAPFDKAFRRAAPGDLPDLMRQLQELIVQAEAELPCEITATDTV